MLRKLVYSLLCLSLLFQNLILVEAETEIQTVEINAQTVAKGIKVQYRTVDEIRSYVSENGQKNLPPAYATEPDTENPPYAPGSLTDEYLADGLKAVNTMRYIAGLDPVTLDSSYNAMCQAGTLINAVNNVMTHTPSKPDGMDDELYQLGYEGTSSSNIAAGYSNLASAVINGWMEDGDPGNISRIGHRRWVLHAPMKKTGFGHVGIMSAMYAFDNVWGSSDYTDNVWPAQNMPVEYFGSIYPWSVSTGKEEDINSVTVKMTKENDGTVYSFSNTAADGYFNVQNSNYGNIGAIIWRPEDVTYQAGDIYHVEISGLSAGMISYTVNFFNLFTEEETMTLSETDLEMLVGETKTIYPVFEPQGINDSLESASMTYSAVCPIDLSMTTGSVTFEAIAEGTATVTVYSVNGLSASVDIKVTKADAVPASIALSPTSVSVKAGSTVRLSANLTPANADRRVTYTSSDPSIAGVDQNGNVRGIKPGKAVITASTVNGLTATCEVRVLFTDVADAKQYFYEPVYWAVDNGITVGAGGPGKFSPNAPCTREQIVTFLWRLMGEPEPESYLGFSDVKESDWFYKPISWAASKGITVGLNDGTGRFGVGQPCTREQCVTFLHRAADKPAVGTHQEFTDVTSDRYYYDAISWAASKGITVGLNDGTGRFGVGQKCTRAMIVTFLRRFDMTR